MIVVQPLQIVASNINSTTDSLLRLPFCSSAMKVDHGRHGMGRVSFHPQFLLPMHTPIHTQQLSRTWCHAKVNTLNNLTLLISLLKNFRCSHWQRCNTCHSGTESKTTPPCRMRACGHSQAPQPRLESTSRSFFAFRRSESENAG